ncbi:hypothetical protein CWE23_00225 [Idiomarina aquatica]|uniref:Uncharacterized protein n=1 Tax=Idiomarina aquatica TaxID=1327752 RepID=A0AA94EEV7_9GAMM|nr:hypothetical protein CWE23_00225 [Idiomarina aquatica]
MAAECQSFKFKKLKLVGIAIPVGFINLFCGVGFCNRHITKKYYRQQKALAATSTRCAAFRAKFWRYVSIVNFESDIK